jgi:hypothetical protein
MGENHEKCGHSRQYYKVSANDSRGRYRFLSNVGNKGSSCEGIQSGDVCRNFPFGVFDDIGLTGNESGKVYVILDG